MIILAAVLIFAVALWAASVSRGHDTETRKVAVRTEDHVRKQRSTRVIDE